MGATERAGLKPGIPGQGGATAGLSSSVLLVARFALADKPPVAP